MNKDQHFQFAGIIPARYASSRYPGKPLVLIGNKTMIQRVYDQASKIIDEVWVATDDKRIFDAVTHFGGKAIMTSADHLSGTDRCAEAIKKINEETDKKLDIVVNIQGDEPFIKPEQIALLMKCFDDETVELATLIRKVEPGEDVFNPNQPKVILDSKGNAIYFSRAAIPYIRDTERSDWSKIHVFYNHIGLYALKVKHSKIKLHYPEALLKFLNHLNRTGGLKMVTGSEQRSHHGKVLVLIRRMILREQNYF